MFAAVHATDAERIAPRPGDDIVAPADVVMDRAFTLAGAPETVWPWLVQLGKRRAGWYLPRTVERLLPRGRRAVRHISPECQQLQIGDVIPDYGGRNETFQVARIEPPHSLVYTSRRGSVELTWSLTLEPLPGPAYTRVFLRLRLAPVRRKWLAESVGELLDLLTVVGLAAGLRERLAETRGN